MSESLKKQVDGTHYKTMGIQPWEIIEKNHLDYFEGAALKYLLRWRHKDGIIDLDKIIHYVERIKELALSGYYDDATVVQPHSLSRKRPSKTRSSKKRTKPSTTRKNA